MTERLEDNHPYNPLDSATMIHFRQRQVSNSKETDGKILSNLSNYDESTEKRYRFKRKRSKHIGFAFGTILVLMLMNALVHRQSSKKKNATIESDHMEGHVRGSRRLLNLLRPTSRSIPQKPIKVLVLEDHVKDAIFKEVIKLQVNTSNLTQVESFIKSSTSIVKDHLDEKMFSALQELHDQNSPTSAILFRNIPVDPYIPPTPTVGKTLRKPTNVAEALLVGIGELARAHVVGYSSETQYSNPWIHEGFPRNSPGSALTKASDLSFHQDMSYQEKAPDLLGLVCIREGHDKSVSTELVDNRDVFDLLPADSLQLLQESRFHIKTSGWVDLGWSSNPVLQGRPLIENSSIHLPVDWDNMMGIDVKAEYAVKMLKRAIAQAPKHSVHFLPGDLLLFSNRRTIHSRSPYTDLRFDGGDRVLNRAYFLKSMSVEERLSRMIQ